MGTGAQCYNNITENYYLVYLQVGSKWSVYLLCDTDLFQQKGTFFPAVIHYRQLWLVYRPMHFLNQLNTWCFINEITIKSHNVITEIVQFILNNVLEKKNLEKVTYFELLQLHSSSHDGKLFELIVKFGF